MKTMCLIIPTKDRPDAINAYLASQAYIAGQLDIDILIQDSSESDKTRRIVEEWQRQHLCKIDYFYYTESQKCNSSIDEKIQEISQIASKKYTYLCFSSDGTILQMKRVWSYVESYFHQGFDLIIQGTERLDGQNEVYFNEGATLLQKCIWRMVALNSTIVSSKFMLACLAFNIQKGDPQDLWIPMIYFRVIAARSDVRSVYLYMPGAVKVNPFISESFWRVQGLALWQWGERWCIVIDSLPSQYNGVKASALLSHDAHCHIFSPISIIGLRAYNNFSLADIKRYKHYINRVTRTPVWFFILVAMLIHPTFAKILKRIYKQWKGLKV